MVVGARWVAELVCLVLQCCSSISWYDYTITLHTCGMMLKWRSTVCRILECPYVRSDNLGHFFLWFCLCDCLCDFLCGNGATLQAYCLRLDLAMAFPQECYSCFHISCTPVSPLKLVAPLTFSTFQPSGSALLQTYSSALLSWGRRMISRLPLSWMSGLSFWFRVLYRLQVCSVPDGAIPHVFCFVLYSFTTVATVSAPYLI